MCALLLHMVEVVSWRGIRCFAAPYQLELQHAQHYPSTLELWVLWNHRWREFFPWFPFHAISIDIKSTTTLKSKVLLCPAHSHANNSFAEVKKVYSTATKATVHWKHRVRMACGREKHRMQFKKLFVKFSIIKILRAHKKTSCKVSMRAWHRYITTGPSEPHSSKFPHFNCINKPFECPIQNSLLNLQNIIRVQTPCMHSVPCTHAPVEHKICVRVRNAVESMYW